MTEASAHGLPADPDLRSRTDLYSPFSELVSAPTTVVGKTGRILTTPFGSQVATAPVATADTATARQTVPVGVPTWSSPSCMAPAVSDINGAGRPRTTATTGVKSRFRPASHGRRRTIH